NLINYFVMALIKKDSSGDKIHILLAKHLSRETDANEAAIVETWVKENESHSKYLEELQLIWNESKKLTQNRKPDIEKALTDFRERTKATSTTPIYKMHWWQV